MYEYHHIGIPTTERREGERHTPDFEMWSSGYEGSEFRVQWMRFEDDCDLRPLIQTVAHTAFKVDDLDRAIQGRTVIHGPEEPLEGFRVAFREDGDAPIELIETELTEDEVIARRQAKQRQREDGARERELAEAFLARRVDGLILAPSGRDHSYLQPERDAGIAVAFVDRPPAYIDADCVLSDNAGGAFAATAHLLAAGHRRVGFLGDREAVFTARERLPGYRRALEASRLPFHPALVRMDVHDRRAASEAAGDLLAAETRRPRQRPEPDHSGRRRAVAYPRPPAHDRAGRLRRSRAPRRGRAGTDGDRTGRRAARAGGRGVAVCRLEGDRGAARRVVVPTTLLERGSGELRP
jgi:Periplasmic binding proteins and sugar binding domain of LacI family